jgi:hypothetical protein
MTCKSCHLFVQDFLPFALSRDHPLYPKIRSKNLGKIASELSEILIRISHTLPKKEYEKAWQTSNRIARRGRPAFEYEAVLNLSTLNLLKFSHPWISAELSSVPYLLMEMAVVRSKDRKGVQRETWDYLNYLIPVVLRCIYEIHDDHMNPKGIYTNVGSMIQARRYTNEDDKATLYDRDDDYQKEILEEDDDDLYT